VKAWAALFGENQTGHAAEPGAPGDVSGLQRFVAVVSRFNIFIIGVMVFGAALAYWVLPNFILFAGKSGIAAINRYRWAALGAAAIFVGSGLWIIYLRYLLAKKSIESHKEVEKYRLQLEYKQSQPSQLTYNPDIAPDISENG
jgi:hypothetical protein